MGYIKSGLFALLAVQTLLLSTAFAEYETQSFSPQCSVRPELYDPEVMANTMANPQRFKEVMTVMNQHDTIQIMMSCASNPEQWTAMMNKVSDPNKMMATMTVFMNPQFYTNWMTAFMNPEYYKPL